jgi:enoyl-CoA hydratase
MSKITVGQSASVSKRFSEEEVNNFAALSLDFNPVHLDPAFAKTTVFGQQIVHGMLAASLFSGLLGKHLPGEGTIYLGQNLKFKKPIFIDQEVTATVEVIEVREDKPIITLSATCTNDAGQVVISGEAVVMYEG